MRLFRQFAVLALLLAAASPAFADIALPKRPGVDPNEVRRDLPRARMVIERVEGLREARLLIPRSQLQELGLAAGIDAGDNQPTTFGSAGTVVGGVFVSLAVVLTGLLLVRSRRGLRAGRAVAAVALCAVAAAAAAVAAYANAAPPRLRPQDPGTLVKAVTGAPLSGSIRVEVVDEGYEIKLLVPPAKTRNNQGEEEE